MPIQPVTVGFVLQITNHHLKLMTNCLRESACGNREPHGSSDNQKSQHVPRSDRSITISRGIYLDVRVGKISVVAFYVVYGDVENFLDVYERLNESGLQRLMVMWNHKDPQRWHASLSEDTTPHLHHQRNK